MSQSAKILPARFFETAGGSEPVRDWLLDMDKADRRAISADIATVEHGWPIGMPTCRPLGEGLWEVRSNISGGRVARVIFGIAKERMVLLHGFIKKTQKTPKADLDLARKRKQEFEQ